MTTRRDRYGEPAGDQALDEPGCCGGSGWRDRENAVPCGWCRPWLVDPAGARPPRPEELAAARGRHATTGGRL